MPKISKNNYKKASVSTGRVENPTTLDQLWGFDTGNKFGTLDLGVYTNKLNSLNLSDLQDEAKKLGIPPIDDKSRLIRSLVNEFRVYASNARIPSQPKSVDPSKVSKEVLEFMKEGK